MKKNVFLTFLMLFLTFLALELNHHRKRLFVKVQYYSRSTKKSKNQNLEKLMNLDFRSFLYLNIINKLDQNHQSIKLIDSKFYLIIFFNTLDCPTCLLEAPYWSKIFENYPDSLVQVVGVGNSLTKNNLHTFTNRRNLKFPIIYDKNDTLKTICKIPETPLRIILDKDFKVLDIKKPSETDFANKSLYQKIAVLIEEFN